MKKKIFILISCAVVFITTPLLSMMEEEDPAAHNNRRTPIYTLPKSEARKGKFNWDISVAAIKCILQYPVDLESPWTTPYAFKFMDEEYRLFACSTINTPYFNKVSLRDDDWISFAFTIDDGKSMRFTASLPQAYSYPISNPRMFIYWVSSNSPPTSTQGGRRNPEFKLIDVFEKFSKII